MSNDIIFALRVHRKQSNEPLDSLITRLLRCIKSIHEINYSCLVAYDALDKDLEKELYDKCPALRSLTSRDFTNYDDFFKPPPLEAKQNDKDDRWNNSSSAFTALVPVAVWAQYTPALNALLITSSTLKFKYICYLSLEQDVKAVEISPMLNEMECDHNVLVCGKALSHKFQEGLNELNGMTCPWNTCAVWNVNHLVKTGFLLISDGLLNGVNGGIEEVPVVALHCSLNKDLRAVLLKFPSKDETVVVNDETRQKYQEKKMKSKEERAQKQLAQLGLAGTSAMVLHKALE